MFVRRSVALVAALAASTVALMPVALGTAGAAPAPVHQAADPVTQLPAGKWEDSPVYAKWRDLGGATFAGDKVGDEIVLSNGIRYAKFSKFNIVITWREGAGAHWMSGAISQMWQSGGVLATSAATMDQVPVNRGSQAGAAIAYDTGYSVYYSDAYGAHAVSGRQRDKYWANGSVTGRFGWPVSGQLAMADNGGVAQLFSEAVTLYQQVPATSEPFWISGALRDKYKEKGGPNGFGWLVEDQVAEQNSGWSSKAAKGSIFWSAQTGAHALSEFSTNGYLNMGGPSGHLGYPTTDVSEHDGGETTEFGGGRTFYARVQSSAYFWLGGAIRDEYNRNGGTAGPLGWPRSNPTPAPGTDGQYARFGDNFDKVILWGPRTGASVVSGKILERLRRDGDVAVYGLPQHGEATTGEYRFQQFENATVFVGADNVVTLGWDFRDIWWQTGGTASPLGMPKYDVQLVHGQTDKFTQNFDNGWIFCDYGVGECAWGLWTNEPAKAQVTPEQVREKGTKVRATTSGPRK